MTPPDATILICTFNRSARLSDTLQSLAALRPSSTCRWNVVVVDNGSSDETAAVVERAKAWLPVPLEYVLERRSGRSVALNTGLRHATGRVVVFTDDDVQVPPNWLDAMVAPLLEGGREAYTGGPVRPLWGGAPPAWLDQNGNQLGPIAALDYGRESFVFEQRRAIPLGVNMAVRREVFERVGGFHRDLGRTSRSLLGQEMAEFFQRCRSAGFQGRYVPDGWLEHIVPAERLRLGYFSRWWYWKGISQARWHRMHGQTETGVNLNSTPKLFGVPRYAFRTAVSDCLALARALCTVQPARAAASLFGLMYFIGYCRQCWLPLRQQGASASSPSLDRNGQQLV